MSSRRPSLATDLLICRQLEVDERALNTHPFFGTTLSAFRPYTMISDFLGQVVPKVTG